MLQNKFEMPLDLAVNDSKIFHFYLTTVFLLSIVSILISSFSLVLQLFLIAALIVMMLLIIKKQRVNKITHVKLSRDDKWEIEVNNTQNFDVELQGECIVTYFLVWLNFTTCNSFGRKKTFHILLLPDSVNKNLFRQLRVRLRFLKKLTVEDVVVHKENPIKM